MDDLFGDMLLFPLGCLVCWSQFLVTTVEGSGHFLRRFSYKKIPVKDLNFDFLIVCFCRSPSKGYQISVYSREVFA